MGWEDKAVLRHLSMIVVVLLIAVLAMWNQPAQAHHSRAAFGTNVVEMRGIVAQVDWGNPHVVFFWDVKGEDGKVVRWSGEMASVESMIADGMTRNTLKVGDDIIVTCKPAKAGTPVSIVS